MNAYADIRDKTSGIWGWSTPTAYEKYMIFCVGNNIAKESAFRAWAVSNEIGFKNLQGRYKGTEERSFIVNRRNEAKVYPWFANEESVLYLSEMVRGRNRMAALHYLDDRPDALLGPWREVDRSYALKQDAWTYDPSADQYWVAGYAHD